MWTVLVSLCVLCTMGAYSENLTKRKQNQESTLLVPFCKRYLSGVNKQWREFLERGEKEIDKCKAYQHKCHRKYGVCKNTVKCHCKSGFRGNGSNCRDINECLENTHDCHRPHAMCTNTIGSFECICKRGFEMLKNGRVCVDINECVRGLHTCFKTPTYSTCTNTIGSYTNGNKPKYPPSTNLRCFIKKDRR